ncbi:MAG: class I SAM-dependent methyltransferase [bacterium]
MTIVNVDCVICGSDKYRILYKDSVGDENDTLFRFRQSDPNNTTRQIVKCEECGLVFTSPREDEETLNKIYSQVDDIEYIKESEWKIKSFIWNKNKIEEYINGGKILDVGCGHGFFLEILNSNWDAYGIDPSVSAVEVARRNGHNVVLGAFNEASFPPNYFDCITCLHVLEHTSNPKKFLMKSNYLLKKGGIIYIEVPDISSSIARFFKRNWWYIMRFHTYYFTKKTLNILLKETDFEPIDWIKPIKTWSIRYILWKLIPLGEPFKILNKLVGLTPLSNINITIRPPDQIGVIAVKVRG